PKMSAFWAVLLLCSLLTPSQGLGIMSSVANSNGLLSDLLGKDGVVGGLLDKDGILGGLLGKDGLVDGLLDAVLDLLIGKDGILGKNGLVGNLLGGNGGDVAGLKIMNNTLPKISLRSLRGFGHQVGFNTQLLVESMSVPGTPLCVQVEVDAVILVRDNGAALQNNKDCQTFDISIRVSTYPSIDLCHFLFPIFLLPRPKVPLLDQPLQSLLSDALQYLGAPPSHCSLKAFLPVSTAMLPLGALGDLPPFSIISGDAIQLDLNLRSSDMDGGMMAPIQVPPIAASLLLATGRPPRLSLSQRALSNLLEPAQEQGAFNINITNSMVGCDAPLQGRVGVLVAFGSPCPDLPLPLQLAKILPGSLPLELRVRVANEPMVTVMDRRATATLSASIDILSPSLQSSQKRLFSLDADIVLNVMPSVSDGKLETSLAVDRLSSSDADTRLLPLQLPQLAEWLQQVLADAYIPAVNGALRISIPLPNSLNINLRNARVDITDVRI
ncbi:BPIB3 protein, partial [Hydrobates tethys]|nr:BPIB3 protein [Oceanodroma tethys]